MELSYRVRVYVGTYTCTIDTSTTPNTWSWNWGTLTEYSVSEGSLSLEQNLIKDEIHFGACYSSKFSCQLYGTTADLSGQWVKVVREASGGTQTDIFCGKIDTCTKDYSGSYRDIEAYDFMYDLRTTNVASVWNNQWGESVTSHTVNELLTTVLSTEGINITITNQSALVNRNVVIPKTGIYTYSKLTLETFLHAVGEMNGIVWKINNDHTLTAFNFSDTQTVYDISDNMMRNSSEFEEYEVDNITSFDLYESSEIVRSYNTGNNSYPISNNFLLLSLTDTVSDPAQTNALDAMFNQVSNIQFTPFSIKTAEPDWTNVVLGQEIEAEVIIDYTLYPTPASKTTITGYIGSLKFSGIQLMDVTAECPANGEKLTQTASSSDDGLTTRGDATVAYVNQKVAAEASARETAINHATQQITGANGGNVVIRYDTNDEPIEILIMDTKDITTAQKVWRWNLEGLGYSSNGVEGPYSVGLTDGTLDAELINVEHINADNITLGSLASDRVDIEVGGKNLIANSDKTAELYYGSSLNTYDKEGVMDSSVPSGNCCTFTCTAVGSGTGGIYLTAQNYDGKIKTGDKVAFSVWLKSSRAYNAISVHPEFCDEFYSSSLTTSWTRFSVTGTALRDTTSGSSQVAITFYSSEFQVDDVLYLSSPMLENASKCSNWAPAPEDTTSEIDSVTQAINTVQQTLADEYATANYVDGKNSALENALRTLENTVNTNISATATLDADIEKAQTAIDRLDGSLATVANTANALGGVIDIDGATGSISITAKEPGSSGNETKVIITSTGMELKVNSTTVARYALQGFETPQGAVADTLYIGDWMIKQRDNGNLSFSNS